jgi:hypothetical protein
MNHKGLVSGSLGLGEIINLMKREQYNIWYADRRARLMQFNVVPNSDLNKFSRFIEIHVIGWNELQQKTVVPAQYHVAGQWFDRWYKYGHFFGNKNDAVKYMVGRVETGRKDIVTDAKEYIEKHPECVL